MPGSRSPGADAVGPSLLEAEPSLSLNRPASRTHCVSGLSGGGGMF